MKAKKPLLILTAMFLVVAGGFLYHEYLFGGPYRFVRVPLREESLLRLQSSPLTFSAADAAYEYLCGLYPDPPKRSKLDISVRYTSGQEAVVNIVDRDCQDDSIYVTYDRLTLRFQSSAWLPNRHQAAWQGRGRIGWTTRPTS